MISNFRVSLAAFLLVLSQDCMPQVINDTLAEDFRTKAAKNFSRYRTVNFSWETKVNHDYTLSIGDNEVENGRKKGLHAIHFSTMLPILKERKLSLYANIRYDSYNFDRYGSEPSSIFNDISYDYYAGGITGSYYMSLCNKPLIVSADIVADGWKHGWGRLQGRMSAIMVVSKTRHSAFSAGLMGMTLFNSVPVMPVLAYWHRFGNPNLSIDITLPSQLYLRYEMNNQRLSAGAAMSVENFYLDSGLDGVPSTCFYSDAVMKPEIVYEYIINRHLYLSARAGVSMVMKGGLYTKNRKDITITDEQGRDVDATIKQDRSPIPFFNIGVSYSLFK